MQETTYIGEKEVNAIHTTGPLQVGQVFLEDAKLGRHKNFFTKTQLNILQPGLAVYETTSDNPYYLKSVRRVESLPNGSTLLSYEVEVEKKMLDAIIGFKVPLGIARSVYRNRMRRYLRKYDKIKKTLGSCGTSPGRAQE